MAVREPQRLLTSQLQQYNIFITQEMMKEMMMTPAVLTTAAPALTTLRSARRKSFLRSVVPTSPALFHAWRP